MKRDWDLIRDILTQIEALSPRERDAYVLSVPRDHKSEEKRLFLEHVLLLEERGFVKGKSSSTGSSIGLISPDLTWEGHDLLATIRSKPVWEKIKSTAQEKGIELSLDAVVALAKAALAWVVAHGS